MRLWFDRQLGSTKPAKLGKREKSGLFIFAHPDQRAQKCERAIAFRGNVCL
jgi:hypothetical protein